MSLGASLLAWPLRLRDLGRIRRIAGVLTRHGFQDIAARLGFVSWARSAGYFLLRRPRPENVPVERRLRQVLEELGPTFIKLGQMLATRPDLVPLSLIRELKHLHDEVPPFPFEEVRAILEEDYKRPVEEVFESVEPVPMAAASIAQVHQAVLKGGDPVVIKVQRPALRGLIGADLRILGGLAALLEQRVPEIRAFRPVAIAEEFKRSLTRETDFLVELSSMQRYRQHFADEPMLHVPRPFPEWSTRRVLVMERVEGIKVTEVAALKAQGVDLRAVVDLGMKVTLRSIFEFGFFHADPHPGNFFVRADGSIVLLDFGMMGSVEPRRLDEMLTFMVAILTGDLDMVINLLLDADLIGDDTDLRAMRSEMRMILDRYANASLQDIDVSSFLQEVFEVNLRHHVVLPADLLLVGKAMATMEGIGREVCPEYKPLDAIRPYLTEVYVRRMLDAKRHSQVVARSLMDGLALLKDAPFDLRRVLRKLRRGELTLVLRSADEESRRKSAMLRADRLMLAGLFPVFFFGAAWLLWDVDWEWLRVGAGAVSGGLAWLFFVGWLVSLFRGDGR